MIDCSGCNSACCEGCNIIKVKEALLYLVNVKEHKEKNGKDGWYEKHKLLAWELARQGVRDD